MNCDRAQAVLSDRLDGERSVERVGAAVDEHTATCPRCRSFEANALRVRASVRLVPAEPVPDLVGPIMARVSSEAATVPRGRWRTPPARASRSHRLTPVIAAMIAGLMAGSVVVGGPWQRSTTTPIAAAAVVMDVQAAAPSLDAFAATFAVTEHGLSPEVPERRLRMDVAFLAPQRFRLDVHDETAYASSRWTPTNLTFIADGSSTYRSGATGCPADLPAGGCPPTRTTVTTHSVYSVLAPAPADLVLPLTTFSSANGIEVLGTDRVAGRDAIRVRLTFARARPLFPFLQLGGTWRPFFDDDRVDLWLDASGWFPLRYTVYPSSDPSRAPWELRFGLPHEATGEPIFDVRLTSLDPRPADPSTFEVPGFSRGRSMPLASLARRVGYLPATPTSPGALRLSSAVVPPGDEPDAPESVLLYTDGMAYVRIGERPDWQGTDAVRPRGRVRPAGGSGRRQRRVLRTGGRGARTAARDPLVGNQRLPRVQPAARPTAGAGRDVAREGRTHPRHLANADRFRHLGRAGRAAGRPRPVRRSPSSCRRPFRPGTWWRARRSRRTPTAGSSPSASCSVNVRATRRGAPIVLHVQAGAALPPASSAHQVLVDLDGTRARWTASREQLEWVAGGAYLSLEGDPSLAAVLELASRIRPVDGSASP